MLVTEIESILDEIFVKFGCVRENMSQDSEVFGELFFDFMDAFDALSAIEKRFDIVLDTEFSLKKENSKKLDMSFISLIKRNDQKEWTNFTKKQLIDFIGREMQSRELQ